MAAMSETGSREQQALEAMSVPCSDLGQEGVVSALLCKKGGMSPAPCWLWLLRS